MFAIRARDAGVHMNIVNHSSLKRKTYFSNGLLWAVGCIIVHDFYLIPREISADGWPGGIMFAGAAVTFIWPFWRSLLFCWMVGMGVYALVAFIIVNSMDAAAMKAAGWPFYVLFFGGIAAIMWPHLLSQDRRD
jgi:hypothetical protein